VWLRADPLFMTLDAAAELAGHGSTSRRACNVPVVR